MDFIALATQIQQELDGETVRLKEKEDRINENASRVADQLATAEQRIGELHVKEQALQDREERVTQRELTVRRDEDVQSDLASSVALNKDSVDERKKAQVYLEEARVKLENLDKRELALSEREKTYKQELELEVMRNFTFRK